MAETTEQLQDTEPLESRIDALLEDIDATTAKVRAELDAAGGGSEHLGSAATATETEWTGAQRPDTILDQVAAELDDLVAPTSAGSDEDSARGAASDAAARSDAPPTIDSDPAGAAMRAVGDELDRAAEVSAVVEPDLDFVAPDACGPGEATLSAADAAAMQVALDPGSPPLAPAEADTTPAPTIEELDDALAAQATAAVEEAISHAVVQAKQQREAPKPLAPMPPTTPVTVIPIQAPAPRNAAEGATPTPETARAETPLLRRGGARVGAVLDAALAPVARVGARVPESTRQTIGYLAVMTAFFAVVMWGIVLLRRPIQPDALVAVPLVLEGRRAPETFDARSPAEKAALERAAAGAHAEHGKSEGEKQAKKAAKGEGKPPAEKKPGSHGADAKKADGAGHH